MTLDIPGGYPWRCPDCIAQGWAVTRTLAHEGLARHIGDFHNVVPWMDGDA